MEVVVITGIGGMGMAVARRLGVGRQLVLADFDAARLEAVAATLSGEGYAVQTQKVDVSDADSVARLAETAAKAGVLRTLVHTAGLSPTMASAERILVVDLAGTIHVLDAFLPYVQPGTVGVFIASMAGSLHPFPADMEKILATTPTAGLGELIKKLLVNLDTAKAYGIAKRCNQLRVQAAAPAWGKRGGRVVSISPGVISTPMGQQELEGHPKEVNHMLSISPVNRIGTAEDIASAVDWLASPAAGFITGSDVLVDGGVVSALRWSAAS